MGWWLADNGFGCRVGGGCRGVVAKVGRSLWGYSGMLDLVGGSLVSLCGLWFGGLTWQVSWIPGILFLWRSIRIALLCAPFPFRRSDNTFWQDLAAGSAGSAEVAKPAGLGCSGDERPVFDVHSLLSC